MVGDRNQRSMNPGGGGGGRGRETDKTFKSICLWGVGIWRGSSWPLKWLLQPPIQKCIYHNFRVCFLKNAPQKIAPKIQQYICCFPTPKVGITSVSGVTPFLVRQVIFYLFHTSVLLQFNTITPLKNYLKNRPSKNCP